VASRLRDRPRFTEIHAPERFALPTSAVYISGTSGEERSQHVADLAARSPRARFIEVQENGFGSAIVRQGGSDASLALRSSRALSDFWGSVEDPVFLDITGLTHPVWAPLMRAGLAAGRRLSIVYVEPQRYRFNRIRTEGELFDLSTRFGGIASLPGFLSLAEPPEDDIVLVALLGFEGPRFSMVLNEVEVPQDRIVPIVGVPGFQAEFVFHAYQGNRLPLEETASWMAMEFAAANCPFSCFYTLSDLAAQRPDAFFRIAPIGTKPHGVGALLFALSEPERVELIYDHPIRREGRTTGSARLLVYHVHALRAALRF